MGVHKLYQITLTSIKNQVSDNTIIMGDLNTPLSKRDSSTIPKNQQRNNRIEPNLLTYGLIRCVQIVSLNISIHILLSCSFVIL